MSIPDSAHQFFIACETGEGSEGYREYHHSHTVDGPVPARGNTVSSEYVYAMQFTESKISHMTKIWNDGYALKERGWT